jgi:CHAT domain-containing protein
VWLALAGANHAQSGEADENDGLLTADEVVTLDLSDVDWVVLSACQSGLGNTWPLEGSVGMRRAFRLAGANAVIASEWGIDDEATREWMRALYAARATDGGSVSRAMRAASRAVLESRRHEHRTTHPFYWAAFTATGR